MNSPERVSADEFVGVLKQREQDAQAEVRKWKWRFKALACLVILVPVLGWHWVECFVAPRYLKPSEDDTKTLYLHRRHWLGRETIDTIKARRTDHGSTEWMREETEGKWAPAFEWRDEND